MKHILFLLALSTASQTRQIVISIDDLPREAQNIMELSRIRR